MLKINNNWKTLRFSAMFPLVNKKHPYISLKNLKNVLNLSKK